MKVIIAGSRGIEDYTLVESAVKASAFEITQVVSGYARGVDRLGEQWAYAHNIPIARFPADWNRYGKRAGILRNAEMAAYADALILVWDGQSRGSAHMKSAAEREGLNVFVFRPKYPARAAPNMKNAGERYDDHHRTRHHRSQAARSGCGAGWRATGLCRCPASLPRSNARNGARMA